MNPDTALDQLATMAGVVPVYRDLAGAEQPTGKDTKLALLKAAGWQLDNGSMIVEAARHFNAEIKQRMLPEDIIVTAQKPTELDIPEPVAWWVNFENLNGHVIEGQAETFIELPAMPSGLHELVLRTKSREERIRLIAAPRTAPSVFDITGQERTWGANAALYGLHSRRNPGIGDYVDLAEAAKACANHGAGFFGINPVHALGWNSPDVKSPYSPSHRGFLNTSHIAVDQISPASGIHQNQLGQWRAEVNRHSDDLIDYDTHSKYQRPPLRSLFDEFQARASQEQRDLFASFLEQEGTALSRFTQFESLSDDHGPDWQVWPEESKSPDRDLKTNPKNADFHAWLQWQANCQLRKAQQKALSSGMGLGLYLDLAVGSRRDGAEAWSEQNTIAKGVSIGAPPDQLSPAGQNWNLTAFAPRKLAGDDYRSFRTVLAQNMRHCGILRIDHILGLNRSYWIPDDGTPGGYVRNNFEVLLALVRIEAQQSNTVIIGEDLGLVPEGLRTAVQQSGIYSYSVLQYEKNKSGRFKSPSQLRKQSLACFGTHDTPTLNGFAQGQDIDWWERLSWVDEQTATEARSEREIESAQLKDLSSQLPNLTPHNENSKLDLMSHSVHGALASSPVTMISVQLDDVEGKVEAQNLPGTIDEHPNWCRRSSTPTDDLQRHSGLAQIGQLMTLNHRSNTGAL